MRKKENRTAGSFVHRSPLKDDKKPRWDFFFVQLKYCLYCLLLPGASLKICWEKRKSSASRLDTKYLWHMIYIIKEDKSPEFTWLVTRKSGGVNVASHICSCSANHANSHWWMEERREATKVTWIGSSYSLCAVVLAAERGREKKKKKLLCLSFHIQPVSF